MEGEGVESVYIGGNHQVLKNLILEFFELFLLAKQT